MVGRIRQLVKGKVDRCQLVVRLKRPERIGQLVLKAVIAAAMEMTSSARHFSVASHLQIPKQSFAEHH